MSIITLFEHQTRSYKELGISPDDPLIRGLEEINAAAGNEIVQLLRKGIRATQFVGVVRAGRTTLQILPKIDYAPLGDTEASLESQPHQIAAESATLNLLHLISYTRDLPIHELEIAGIAAQRSDWIELLTRLLAVDLHTLMQRGLEHNYIRFEENLPVMRGRWQVERQLLHHPHMLHRFDVVFDEFSPDTPLNQVFRYVAEMLLHQTQDALNRSFLLNLSEWLSSVNRLPFVSPDQLDRILFTRLNERFQPAFNLARLFIEGSVIRFAAGKRETYAFVFDMNSLFEAFVAGFIKRFRSRIFPSDWEDMQLRVQSEGKTLYLAERSADGAPAFRLLPDILLTRPSGAPILIIDTKYKILDPTQVKQGVAEVDMYQMLAYEVRLDCPRALVIYPQLAGKLPIHERFELYNHPGEMMIATIDLHRPLDKPDGLIEELREIFVPYGGLD